MDENSKQINKTSLYSDYSKFIPKNIFPHKQLNNQDYQNVSIYKNIEQYKKISLNNQLIMNYSQSEINDSKEFKGRKISQSDYYQNIHEKKNHYKHLHSHNLTTCRLYQKKMNKINNFNKLNSF